MIGNHSTKNQNCEAILFEEQGKRIGDCVIQNLSNVSYLLISTSGMTRAEKPPYAVIRTYGGVRGGRKSPYSIIETLSVRYDYASLSLSDCNP